jgi:hypothetical protein
MEESRKQELEKLEAELKVLKEQLHEVECRIYQKERDIDIIKNPFRHIRMTAYFHSHRHK